MDDLKATLKDYAVRLGRRFEEQRGSDSRVKEVILISAVVVLLAGVVLSVRANPELLQNVDGSMVWAILIVGVPVTIALNALEFVFMGRLAERSIAFGKALEVTVIGSAANMLPLPGSTIVRVAGLKFAGVGFKLGAAITLLVSVVWIGVAFLYAGSMLAAFSEPALGWGLVVTGAAALVAVSVVLLQFEIRASWYFALLATKFVLVLIDAVRIYWCFLALGVALSFWQASVFVISSVLGSAVSIVPAGLGVRELLSSGIAPIVGISAAAGFLTATLNRVLGLVVLLPLAGLLAIRERRSVKT